MVRKMKNELLGAVVAERHGMSGELRLAAKSNAVKNIYIFKKTGDEEDDRVTRKLVSHVHDCTCT